MSPNEAKSIIESLANGMDPQTGEVLAVPGVCSQPQVIRALFIAGRALDRLIARENRLKTLPENAGKPWSPSEDSELLKHFDGGLSMKALAAGHGRSNGAIASRLAHLGRIKDSAEASRRTGPIAGNLPAPALHPLTDRLTVWAQLPGDCPAP